MVHHVNIPGDVAIDTTSKTIKTIYFVYQDNAGQDFLYAVARCNSSLIFETGITQSFFFNFTVTNSQTQDMTEFILRECVISPSFIKPRVQILKDVH